MDTILTLGSLFSGIGAFELAAVRAGIKPVWASEIEKAPISIHAGHFPDMIQLGDITQIDGGRIEPVDIITFGSPCQDLSVASGNRAGLSGSKSQLFREAIRVISEMRSATGDRPRYIIWENVLGAFSSPPGDKGADFKEVLEQIVKIKEAYVSIPRPDRWGRTGSIVGADLSVAWRVLDAQHWGVPQRRERIFLVGDFGGRRAEEILFKPESMSKYFTQGEGARKAVAAAAAASAGDAGALGFYVLRAARSNSMRSPDPGSICAPIDVAPVLTCEAQRPEGTHGGALVLLGSYDARGHRMHADPETAPTILSGQSGGAPGLSTIKPILCGYRRTKSAIMEDLSPTLMGSLGSPIIAGTLLGSGAGTARPGGPASETDLLVWDHAYVRRLTPLECERLMGFPDYWTLYGRDLGMIADTPRYKALGNSICLPCVEYILQNMAEEEV